MFFSSGPICAPPSGDMVPLPGMPPLAPMVPCRPPGRPHGHGRGGAGAGFLGFREACLYFSGSLEGARRLFSKTFGRRPLQTFEAVPAPGATMLRWPASSRQEPAQTPLTLDAQSPGTGVSRFF